MPKYENPIRTCPQCGKQRHKSLFNPLGYGGMLLPPPLVCDVCRKTEIKAERMRIKCVDDDQRKLLERDRTRAAYRQKFEETMYESEKSAFKQCDTCHEFKLKHKYRLRGNTKKVGDTCDLCRRRKSSRECNKRAYWRDKHASVAAQAALPVSKEDIFKRDARAERKSLASIRNPLVTRAKKAVALRDRQLKEKGVADPRTVAGLERTTQKLRYYNALREWMLKEQEKGNLHGSMYYITDADTRRQFNLPVDKVIP